MNSLNVRHNLGIPIPDPNLSLLEKKADQNPANRIYRRLEIHFYTGGIEALNSLLGHFDNQAKQHWPVWVKKAAADRDTLPTTLNPPLAANLTERELLQTILNKVLDKVQPSMKSSRPFSRTKSGPAAFGSDASTDRSSRHTASTTSPAMSSRSTLKRRADTDMGDVNKKSRADADPIRDLTASSNLQRHQAANPSARASAGVSVVGAMRLANTRNGSTVSVNSDKPLSRSFVSISTGLSDVSAVFSAYGDAPVGTQDTIEASSQEQQRPVSKHGLASLSQESYGLSPSLEEGLYESFEQSHTFNVQSATKSRPNGTLCYSHSSESIALPSDVEREVSRRQPGLEPKSKAQDQRLSSVWRTCSLSMSPFLHCDQLTRLSTISCLPPRGTIPRGMGGD